MRINVGAASGTIACLAGIPAIPRPFFCAWTQLVQFCYERLPFPIRFLASDTSHHSTARNSLAANFDGDWLLMLDTDHWFEPDLAWRLLDRFITHDLDVLCGIYQYKSEAEGCAPVVYAWGQKPEDPKLFRVANPWQDGAPIIRVDAAGGGCLLVRRRVFDKIWSELRERPFEVNERYQGEDIAFFDRLRRVGLTAWMDTRVESNHLGWKIITRADYNEALAASGAQERPTLALAGA